MKSRHILQNLLLSVGILSAGFGISLLLQQISSSPELVSLVFVLAVFLISLWTQGYIWGILASMASVLIDNFIFTFPYFAFDFLTPENLIAALVMLAVATVTSTLTTKIKEQERIRAETETEKMRGNLLRAISHDLRTPLTTIYGSTSAIIENYDSLSRSQQIRLLCEIREDSQSLIRMVENLLSVTRIDGQKVRVSKTNTVLEELIDSVLVKFRKHFPDQHVRVDIPDEFVSIPMDAMLIQQVLFNILENAVFHAKEMTQLTLSVVCKNGYAEFCVSDDGCGIPADRLDNLFTGYLDCTDTPTDGTRNNMGIGLSVCSTIVKAHGSEIYAKNLSPRGAAFYFSLQMEEAHESEQI